MHKLYFSAAKDKNKYCNLTPILKEAIDWQLIRENYDEVVNYVAPLMTGTVEADVIIKIFSKDNYNGSLQSLNGNWSYCKNNFFMPVSKLRIEIHESLNVVERVNSIMGNIHKYKKRSGIGGSVSAFIAGLYGVY